MRISRKAHISLRATPSGHGATDQALIQGRAKTIRPRYVFLIHGYNTDEADALSDYAKFERNLKDYSVALSGHVMTVSWSGHFRLLEGGALRYSGALDYADYSATLLCKHLEMLSSINNRKAHFIIIGHSMGCRVILKTLDRFFKSRYFQKTIVVDVVLMAAAVRVTAVDQSGGLWAAASTPRERAVLYSEDDSVLDRYFPKGEMHLSVFNPLAAKPKAVGLEGKPLTPGRPWTVRRRMSKFDHGDYWGSKATAAVVARIVRGSVPKEIEERLLRERLVLQSRTIPRTPLPPFWI